MQPVVDKFQQAVGEKGIAAFVGALLMLIPLMIPYAMMWKSWGNLEQRVEDLTGDVQEQQKWIEDNRAVLFGRDGVIPVLREINILLTELRDLSKDTKEGIRRLEVRVNRIETVLPKFKPDQEER